MARASFTLRKATVEEGSYLQYPSSSVGASVAYFPSEFGTQGASISARENDDTLLKSDDLQTLPEDVIVIVPGGNTYSKAAYFTADATDYSQVKITWGVPLEQTITTVPNPTEIIIVYSPNGEPATINDGSILVQTNNKKSEYFHQVQEGVWAYYTLFIKYESSIGDLYYEPAARLSTLVPKNYRSSNDLYSKIPIYYRELDGEDGPLKRFIETISWDVDRFRTLIDYLMVFKDPRIARSQELDKIASDLGFDLRSQDLGAFRLRTLLDSVGILRRVNGTSTGLSTAVTALTGSFIALDTENKKVYVQPQRVNFLKDPSLKFGIASSVDGGSPFTQNIIATIEAGFYDELSPASVVEGGAPDSDYTSTSSNEFWQVLPTEQPNISVLATTTAYLRVVGGDTFYFSAQPVGLNLKIQEAITKVVLYEGSSIGASVPAVEITSSNTPISVGNLNYWKLEVPNTYTEYETAYLFIEFENEGIVVVDDFKLLMLEKNNIGTFFDGNTVEGGWIVDGNNSISDYRWFDPADPESSADESNFSVFSANYQKTKAVINKLQSLVIPVTELTNDGVVYSNRPTTTTYDVIYDYIPGYTQLTEEASSVVVLPVDTGGGLKPL